jgi:type I restriction enzyme, S subunit
MRWAVSDLPENWIEVPLPEISTIEMGQSPDSSTYNNQGKGLPFFQGKAEFGKLYPTVRKWCSQPKKIAEAGDILLSVRAPVGPTNLALEKCCIGRGLAAIRAKEQVSQKYLLHYFRNIEPWLTQQGTGSTFTAISGGFIRELQIPLAPLNEQKRIAEKLDSLLARVDSCQTHLERVPQILKRFRQSVLAAATSGRLTEDWREEKGLSIDDWDTKTGNEIFPFITSGSRWWAKYYSDSGSIFIRVGNLDHDTIELDLSNIQYVTPPDDAESKRTRVQVGDILISITADVGMVGYLRKDIGDAYTNQHVCIARQTGEYNGEFLAYYLTSPVGGLGQLTKAQRGATKAGLTLGDIRNLNFQIPSKEEQAEIVRRVEKLFAYAERLEAHYTSASEHVERLTPSLLAKAFRGELVEQEQG